MVKAIFIAPSAAQASFWARLWGYKGNEYMYVRADEPSRLFGFHDWEWPVYTCGEHGPDSEVWNELVARGFTVFDAQSIDVPENPELYPVRA